MAEPSRLAVGTRALLLTPLLLAAACSGQPEPAPAGESATAPANELLSGAAAVLERGMARVDSAAEQADSLFKPVPLLTPSQEDALRSFGNAAQLVRARRLGIERGTSTAALATLQSEGQLAPLEDSDYWVIARLDHSQPLAVPAVHALLEQIGVRFHARLAELGSPAFRFEISSVLRSAADQQALRRVNPNAALGESTHEYGTTVDVLYSAFAAPATPLASLELEEEEAAWATPFLHRYAQVAAGRVAARRALELKAILGEVLLELQNEGKVMVTLERQQPVFHMTVAEAP